MALVCVWGKGRPDAGDLWTASVTAELDAPESRTAPVASVALDGTEDAAGKECGGTRTVAAAANLLWTASDAWLLEQVVLQTAGEVVAVDKEHDAPSVPVHVLVRVQFVAFESTVAAQLSRVYASASGAGARAALEALERLSDAAVFADESRRALG